MRNLVFLLCSVCLLQAQAATVYTRINNKPADGWAGNNGQYSSQKYIIVYELSDTKGLVWNGKDATKNYVQVTLSDGKISSEDLADYEIMVTEENSNRYYIKAHDGYIGCGAKKNEISFTSGGKECTLASNGGYTMLETNSNTCRFLCYETSSDNYRFRFYYDADKKWDNTKYKNIRFYVLGDVEQDEPQGLLDLQYADIEMYACDSKFPTQNNPYDQYYLTYMFLAQEEDYAAVPRIWLEILALTPYSIEGTYKSDYTPNQKYFLNCQTGAKHSYFIFPNKSEAGWGQASINVAEMKITKVGESAKPNAYVYHIKLTFTDSNKKNWTVDKDFDVYAWWIDCDRSDPKNPQDMTEVAFALESGNHNTESEEGTAVETVRNISDTAQKFFRDGQLLILRNGTEYDVLGKMIK